MVHVYETVSKFVKVMQRKLKILVFRKKCTFSTNKTVTDTECLCVDKAAMQTITY